MTVEEVSEPAETPFIRNPTRSKSRIEPAITFLRKYCQDRLAVVGLVILAIATIVALFPSTFAHYNPFQIGLPQLRPPSSRFWFGTDNLGRDEYSRVVWGTRTALLVALGAGGISGVLGIFIGAISGYHGGWIDDLLSRVFDATLMIPAFFLLLVIAALFGGSINIDVLVIGLTWWPINARIMRSQVLSLKTRGFIRAAVGFSTSSKRIIFTHIIPNGLHAVVTNIALQMGTAILVEAGLSYLGVGDPNIVSWGQLISDGQDYIYVAWWMSFFPGVVMLILVLAFNFVSDGFSHALNPRLSEGT